MPKSINMSNTIKDIWKPEKEGDSIRGFYLEKVKFPNSKFENPAYLIGFPNGQCVALNGDSVTRSNMNKLTPQSNIFVMVTFKGKKQGKNNMYYDYEFKAWQLSPEEIEEWVDKVDIGVSASSDSVRASEATDANDDDLPF